MWLVFNKRRIVITLYVNHSRERKTRISSSGSYYDFEYSDDVASINECCIICVVKMRGGKVCITCENSNKAPQYTYSLSWEVHGNS